MSELSDAAKRQLIESRLAAFAIDSYGHELNRAAAGDDVDAVVAATEAIAAIAATAATYEIELAALPPGEQISD
jgi:hypothetical protein